MNPFSAPNSVNKATINNPNVVVFIPPPVDPGDAPINISNKINQSDANENEDKSNIENPAVRLETE